MSALDDLVVVERVAKLLHLCGKFARVLRADAVIFGRGEDQWSRVLHPWLQLVIWADAGEEGALLRNGDGAIFADPGGARRDLFESQHIEQRDLDDDRSPEIRVLGHLDAHQQAAVGTAHNPKMFAGSDLARDQVFSHGGEVIVNYLPMRLEASLVPGGAELAAAANVCEHINTTMFEPELTGISKVGRRAGGLESAVSSKHRGIVAIVVDRFRMDDEVRDLCAVL